jgi:hypothetical protein
MSWLKGWPLGDAAQSIFLNAILLNATHARCRRPRHPLEQDKPSLDALAVFPEIQLAVS